MASRISLDSAGFPLVAAMPLVSLLNIFTVAEVGNLSIRPIDVLFVLLIFLWIWRLIRLGEISDRLQTQLLYILGFIFSTILGSFFTYAGDVNWPKYLRFMQTMLWGTLAFTFINTETRLNVLIKNIITAGLVLGVASIVLFFTYDDLHRIGSFFSFGDGEGLDQQASYNEIGALYALIIGIYLWRFYKTGLSRFDLIGVAVILSGLFLVQSRSALIAVFLVIITVLSFDVRNALSGFLHKKSLILILAILLVVLIGTRFSAHLSINRLSESFVANSNAHQSMTVRFYYWSEGFSKWTGDLSAFLFGYGNEIFVDYFGAPTTDSFYLDSALSSGLVGLIFLLLIISAPAFRIWRIGNFSRKSSLGLIVAITALSVSVTGNVIVDPMYGGITFSLLYALLSVYGHHRFGSVRR